MNDFLAATEVIDWTHPAVLSRARALANGIDDVETIARACFEWVRDEIRHTADASDRIVTCSASDVLTVGSGYCYAKSHLLAALLRANGVPAGFCYQRLSLDGTAQRFCLHGFNAVLLPRFGWYRVDPRGNRSGIDARFVPPVEHLAFRVSLPGEADFREVRPEPLAAVVETLRRQATSDALTIELPDLVSP